MNKMKYIITFSAMLFCINGFGYKPLHTNNGGGGAAAPVKQSFKTENADCNVPTSQIDLDINNVRTRLLAAGDMWWDTDAAKYEVPKSSGSTTPIHAIFAGAIWVSALDQGGNLKIAGTTFRSEGSDFWAGPLDNSGNVSNSTCLTWDNNGRGHFNVYGTDIENLIQAYRNAGGQYGIRLTSPLSGTVLTEELKRWPGKGNAYLQSKGYNTSDNLAPFYDADADGIYDPQWGDYPIIGKGQLGEDNTAYADQMIFWVMNDKGNVHTGADGGYALGVQVNALAFAFKTSDEVNDMTFYRYTFINKSGQTYNNTYMSQYVDVDLGCYRNDYVGCDTTRSLAFVYNASIDEGSTKGCSGGVNGYGSELPIIAFDYFEGPKDISGNQLGMSSFMYYTNSASSQGDPATAQQFRNYQQAIWRDGRPLTFGGTGYQASGGTRTYYAFPGNPVNALTWTECSKNYSVPAVPTTPDDRRILQTSGPFTLASGVPQNITLGAVFVRPKGGVGICPDINVYLGLADDKAQALFDTDFKILKGPDAPTLVITELDQELIMNITNPSGNNKGEGFKALDLITTAKPGFNDPASNRDSFYTFEGYVIYQLKDDKVSVNDLGDVSKAIPVTQMDVKNGITRLINFKLDPTLNLKLPTIMMEGNNGGVTHSLKITKDFFAEGTATKLVDNKTYFYGVIAYAANSFMPYNPTTGRGQDIEYLQGTMKKYSAIPHKNDGNQNELIAQWGEGIEVKRVEGGGNGGNMVEISSDQYGVLSSRNALDTITYGKVNNPVKVVITDPLQIKEGNFELKIFDTVPTGNEYLSPYAYWQLINHSNGDVIKGERILDRPFQQLVMSTNNSTGETNNYGFSVELGRPLTVDVNRITNAPVFEPIGGQVKYSDAKNKWVSFVKDNDEQSAANWIRSGAIVNGAYDGSFASNFYTTNNTDSFPTDAGKYFGNFADGTWAPYCLTSNYNYNGIRDITDVKSVFGPGFKWRNYNTNGKREAPRNNLEKVPSVDIVFTSDKNMWTRCVVFEAGEEQDGNVGAIRQNIAPFRVKPARKGMLRESASWDKSGQYHDGTNGLPLDTGRSWFPGYAVNVETGERLNMAFAEASDLATYNGADMIWNPTADQYSKVNNGSPIPFTPIWGGRHFIYVLNTPYDQCDSIHKVLRANAAVMAHATTPYSAAVQGVYDNIVWASIPYLTSGSSLKSVAEGIVPNDVKVELRMGKPFQKFATATTANIGGDSMPRYIFSTVGMAPKQKDVAQLKSELDEIRIVPNPYLAYSYYEKAATDYKVKIINLPNRCNINIYNLEGVLVRTITRDIGTNINIKDGRDLDNKKITTNLDNGVEWDLKNDKGIPIGSGVYLFDVNAPGIGSKILRWFGAMRATDVSNF